MNITVAAPPATKIPNFINGHWVESQASEWLDVVNPATAAVLGRVPISDAAEVTRAIDAAQAAFPEWRRTPAEDRIQPLFKLKMLLEETLHDLHAPSRRKMARRSPKRRRKCGAPSRTSKS